MSERKTYLSRAFPEPFDYDLVAEDARQDIERSIDFLTYQRLSVVMGHIGQDRLVHISGRSWKQVSRYLKGDKAPTEVLQAVANETGASIDWLAQGILRTSADVKYQEALLRNAARARLDRMRIAKPEPEWSGLGYGLKLIDQRLEELAEFVPSESTLQVSDQNTANIDLPDIIRLPTFGDVQAAAGHSSVPAAELADGVIWFDRRFLRDQGATPEHCSVIWAKGDSMTPTIPDGSALIVDRSQTAISNGCIMVIGVGDDLLVKRIRRRLDGLIDLISDNQAYAPETLGPDTLQQLRVIGRVVYFCRTP